MLAGADLMIQIIKKDFKNTKVMVEKGLISILTPIVMEIEIDATDKDRILLI